jgi:hypothetical protein
MSPEIHWFHSSLAHEWRTTVTLLVLLKDNYYTGDRPTSARKKAEAR